jgi:hypothetical protein
MGLGAWVLGLGLIADLFEQELLQRGGRYRRLRLATAVLNDIESDGLADQSDIADIRFARWHGRELGERRAF